MKIGIVGLGLIGGCLGLDFKAAGHKVYGIARRAETCQQAIRRQIVDYVGTELTDLKPCDIVVVCTPIATIVPMVKKLATVLSPGTIVTDVGSVKTAIVEEATAHWPYFVGAHPMNGKSEAGLEAAESGIFYRRPYVITPLTMTDEKAAAQVGQLAQQIGSRLYRCTPEEHDRAVAWISHLPVMVSSSLIQSAIEESDPEVLELAQQLASSGFRDTSRVGGGNPQLGLMMAQYNRDEVLRSLKRYQMVIAQTITQVEDCDWGAIACKLEKTKAGRIHFVEN
ncbi:MAG: prephenate/arogenate dehydrogenase [Cyanobacteria bacterium P01_D01_bin.105]